MIHINRIERLSAPHKLCIPDCSKQRIGDMCDKCTRPGFYGPNYELKVNIKGKFDQATRIVGKLKATNYQLRQIKLIETKNNYLEYYV